MLKAVFAGIVALTVSFSASAQDVGAPLRPVAQQGAVLTNAHIAYFKAKLNLTPVQQQFWPAIDAAVREIARQQMMVRDAFGSAAHRYNRSTIAITLTAAAINRLAAAAQPLVHSLDDGQKLDAMRMAQEVGLSSMVSALN
jgi:hypothetical protein